MLVAALTTGCSVTAPDPPRDVRAARAFDDFSLYWLGERFERWDLTSIYPLSEPTGFVSLIYGDCTPHGGSEPSCTPPLEIQISALCSHLHVVARAPIWKHRRVRGAPVGTIDSAPVLFARDAQVKVYRGEDTDPGVRLRALRALRSLNSVPPIIDDDDPIPPPAAGVLAGTRRCAP